MRDTKGAWPASTLCLREAICTQGCCSNLRTLVPFATEFGGVDGGPSAYLRILGKWAETQPLTTTASFYW